MEVELSAIREDRSYAVAATGLDEAEANAQSEAQDGGGGEKAVVVNDSARNFNEKAYSWLHQNDNDDNDNDKDKEEQAKDDGGGTIKPMEIAGPPELVRDAPKNGFLLTSVDSFVVDWFYTVLIGIFVVSFWRGGWVLFDVLSCDQPLEAGMLNGDSFCFLGGGTVTGKRHRTAVEALIVGYCLLVVGLVLLNLGLWRPVKLFVKDSPNQLFWWKSALRIIILLFLGEGTLCIWRGIWYLLDYYVLPDDPTVSAWVTCGLGALLCMIICSSASLLAPPAIFLMDGPAHLPPPIGVTIVTSYRSIAQPANVARENNQKDPIWLIILDMILSFVVLPIGVVGFWRGMWTLLDTWLWNFTDSQNDVNLSILWSFLLGMAMLLVGSEDLVQHFSPEDALKSTAAIDGANHVFGRLRTLVLAFGTVNFWRAIWLFWDEFLGNSQLWSCILSHLLGILGLLVMGCLACITAPPSTLGVDAVAHPDCADEPLFHNIPVPAEALYLLSISKRPEAILEGLQMPKEIMDPTVLSDRNARANLMNQGRAMGETLNADALKAQRAIDCLLVQEDHVFSSSNRQTTQRFTTHQTSAAIQSAARTESSTVLRLTQRHQAKRQKSQFYRNR